MEERDPTKPPPAPEIMLRMDAEGRGCVLITTNVIIFVFALAMAFLLAMARGFFSFSFIIWAVLGLGVFMGLSYYFEVVKGIKRVEVDQLGLNIYRGKNMKLQRVMFDRVTDVNQFHKGARIVVNIMTGGAVAKGPGVTFFSGPRVRITNDYFNDDEFSRFLALIGRFKRQ